MQDRITTIVERALTTTVSNIEHLESQSVRGTSVIKMFFQPGTDISAAIAQLVTLRPRIEDVDDNRADLIGVDRCGGSSKSATPAPAAAEPVIKRVERSLLLCRRVRRDAQVRVARD
jgi:hypothetical protein